MEKKQIIIGTLVSDFTHNHVIERAGQLWQSPSPAVARDEFAELLGGLEDVISVCPVNFGILKLSEGKFFKANVENDGALKIDDRIFIAKSAEEYCNTWRGHKYYEMYPDAQLLTLKQLLIDECTKHDIPMEYKGDEFWKVSKRAIEGEPGIWGACSFFANNYAPHPQPGLIKMLKSLT